MQNTDEDVLTHYRTQIERIFVYYCSFADKQNHTLLKMQNYKRLLSDMQINLNTAITSQLDVVVCSHSSTSGLSLSAFTNILGQISKVLFQGQSKDQALLKLLNQHMQPLYDVILKDTQFGQSIAFISVELLRQNSFIFLKRFESTLLLLYKTYFPQEGKIGKQQEFKMFSKLSRDLTLVPRVINKPISYLIYSFLRQRQSKSAFEHYFNDGGTSKIRNYGFKFICFLEYLIILSYINFKTEERQIIKLYKLLEIIQVSQGVINLAKKIKFKHFILTDNQLQQILKEKKPQILYSNSITVKKITKMTQNPLTKKLGRYFNPLKTKFTELCTKKEVQTNFYLPLQKCKEILISICPKLTSQAIDKLVDSVQRINFQNFINILQKTAQKLQIKIDQIIQQVLEYNNQLFNLATILKNIKLSKKEQLYCREVLRLTQSYMKSIYDYYQTNKTLTLGSYIKCFQQMGAIPQILSPKQAYDIYKVCGIKEDHLTFSQFQQSFLAIIIGVHFQCNLEGIQRLIYFLQKICDSKRGEVLMKKNLLMVKQHPLYMLRLTFSKVYKEIQRKIDNNNKSQTIEEIKLLQFS